MCDNANIVMRGVAMVRMVGWGWSHAMWVEEVGHQKMRTGGGED